jgi:c-di-GMP phosphodiesterase
MTSHRKNIIRIAAVIASISVFLASAHTAVTSFTESQTSKQIGELNNVVLRRSEIAINNAVAMLGEIASKGPLDCSSGTLQILRVQVYQGGTVKDIRAVDRDGSVICSAYSETLEFDNGLASRRDMLETADHAVRLFRVEQFTGAAFGVLRDIDPKLSMVAILGINADLLDIMPTGLRAHSEVSLELLNGQLIELYSPDAHHPGLSNPVAFTSVSDRYPLRATIRIEPDALNGWSGDAYWLIMVVAGILGVVFGLLLVSYLAKPMHPVGELDRALSAQEFKPYFQPIFSLKTGKVLGCEILARWEKADGRIIPPMSFIPLAESSGRIEKLTWQILSSALRDLHKVMKRDKYFKLSVNITPRHLLAHGFIETLREVVATAAVSPRQIVIEVTEREELSDLKKATDVVKQLREFGFRVALDDVGVGHSGLSHIQRLGATTIKIDKFFVDAVTRDQSAVIVIQMLVALARELEMSVVAEGIESQDQIDALIVCGVKEGQGYFVSPPLPIGRFNHFLELHKVLASDNKGAKPVKAA